MYAEGEPATCFYVLLEGEIGAAAPGRRATMSRPPVQRQGRLLRRLLRLLSATGCRRSTTTRCGSPCPRGSSCSTRTSSPQLMHDWFPMAVHLLEGLFFGDQERPGGGRPAGAAARARVADRRAGARAEQPGGRGRPGHRRAARAGRRDARQAGPPGRPAVRQVGPRGAGRAAGRRGRAGLQGQGDHAEPAGDLRRRGRHRRLDGRPRHRPGLGPGPSLRAGRHGHHVARPRRDHAGRRRAADARPAPWTARCAGWPTPSSPSC